MEEGSNSDGYESGGTSPSRQGAGTGNSGPSKLDGDGGGDRNCFWEKGLWNQGFLRGGKNRAKGGNQGGTGQPGGCLARPRVGPPQGSFWSPCGGPPLFLGDSGS